MYVCLYVQLPVGPATVGRLRHLSLYTVHGCKLRNISPRMSYSITKISGQGFSAVQPNRKDQQAPISPLNVSERE